jgi:hypothetical protein
MKSTTVLTNPTLCRRTKTKTWSGMCVRWDDPLSMTGIGRQKWFVLGVLVLGLLPLLLAGRAQAAGSPLDRSFGQNGISLSGRIEEGLALALTRDRQGRLIAGGTSRNENFYLRRYGPNGAPDLTFGDEGWVDVDLGITAAAYALAIAPRGEGCRPLAR